MAYLDFIKKQKTINLEAFLDDRRQARDPTFFDPTGTQVYCGRQGSGKTLSAVKHVRDIKARYPDALLVSNLDLLEYNQVTFVTEEELLHELSSPEFNPARDYVFFEDFEQLALALTKINNGFKGVLYLIDEIHTYFNALDSKNIPPYVFTEISQQRKQRKLIVGTSQLFLRMAKPFREQCDNMINCFTFFNACTVQFAYDGMSVGEDHKGKLRLDGNRRKIGWFWHTLSVRKAYDTYQKVVSGSVQYDQASIMKLSKKDRKALGAGK